MTTGQLAAEKGETCAMEEAGAFDPLKASGKVPAQAGAAQAGQGDLRGGAKPIQIVRNPALAAKALPERSGKIALPPRERTVIRLPAYEQVKDDPVLYAHANRVLHLETNPGNARALVQRHGEGPRARDVWINPPPIPLSTPEMDLVFDLPYARSAPRTPTSTATTPHDPGAGR